MPKFVDTHKAPPSTPESMAQAKGMLGKTLDGGVKVLNAHFTKDGQAYCFCEAPNSEAVVKMHEKMGMPIGADSVKEIVGSLA